MVWSKMDRIMAVSKGEPADRPPISAWRHFPGHERNADQVSESMVAFQKKYDWDYVKINPRAVYYHEVWGNEYDYDHYKDVVPTRTKHILSTAQDLKYIVKENEKKSIYDDQLKTITLIRKALGKDVPLFHSVFTPIGVMLNLCGERSIGRYRESPREQSLLIEIIKEDPKNVHRALRVITESMEDYVSKIKAAGADGVFYAGLGMAREGFFTLQEWEEFVKPYDLQVLAAMDSSLIKMFHTCGIYGNPQRFADYPIQILHWAESATGNPKIKDSQSWLGKIAPMGGVDERFFGTHASEKIAAAAKQSIHDNIGKPFVLAPECSVSIHTYDDELQAFRDSVKEF
jgi:Uroporphyrinogen-III decarboxylase